jgi:hypothetical protein
MPTTTHSLSARGEHHTALVVQLTENETAEVNPVKKQAQIILYVVRLGSTSVHSSALTWDSRVEGGPGWDESALSGS